MWFVFPDRLRSLMLFTLSANNPPLAPLVGLNLNPPLELVWFPKRPEPAFVLLLMPSSPLRGIGLVSVRDRHSEFGEFALIP